MPALHGTSIAKAKKLASEFFNKNEVVTAFDKSGHLSHLEAHLPRQDFYALYSEATRATVYIKGYWLQFVAEDQKCLVLNRNSGAKLQVSIHCTPWSSPKLLFRNEKGVVLSRKIHSLSADELGCSSLGRELAARAAVTAFERLESPTQAFYEVPTHTPSIHVIPVDDELEGDDTGTEEDEPEFKAERVMLN